MILQLYHCQKENVSPNIEKKLQVSEKYPEARFDVGSIFEIKGFQIPKPLSNIKFGMDMEEIKEIFKGIQISNNSGYQVLYHSENNDQIVSVGVQFGNKRLEECSLSILPSDLGERILLDVFGSPKTEISPMGLRKVWRNEQLRVEAEFEIVGKEAEIHFRKYLTLQDLIGENPEFGFEGIHSIQIGKSKAKLMEEYSIFWVENFNQPTKGQLSSSMITRDAEIEKLFDSNPYQSIWLSLPVIEGTTMRTNLFLHFDVFDSLDYYWFHLFALDDKEGKDRIEAALHKTLGKSIKKNDNNVHFSNGETRIEAQFSALSKEWKISVSKRNKDLF